MVFDQKVGAGGVNADGSVNHAPPTPSSATFVWPRRDRFVVFDGQLHHGVMPHSDVDDDDDDDDSRLGTEGAVGRLGGGWAIRETVLVNWWTKGTKRPLPPS